MNSRESRYHSSNLAHEIPYVPYLLSHVNQMRGQLNYVMQAMQNCVATCPLLFGGVKRWQMIALSELALNEWAAA